MELVLNELSYSSEWSDDQAYSLYGIFFEVCLSLSETFKKRIALKYSKHTQSGEVVFKTDPNFLKWLSLQQKDNKSSILSILTGGQFIIDYPYYKVYDEEGKGIGYAHEKEELLLSFQSDEKWKVICLDLIEETLNIETDKIESKDLKVRNCYDTNSRDHHLEFLNKRFQYHNNSALKKIKEEIIKGPLLWKDKEKIFPSLIFCASTEDYINSIQSGDVLHNLLSRLHEYETYFKNWDTGDFDRSKVSGNARLESDTRIEKYDELIVTCPDGKNRLFTYHCNYGFSDLRMHFCPESNTRKCIIGYIGKKIV